MTSKVWEHQEEFKSLYTPDNIWYLYAMGKDNGSLKTLRTYQVHYIGRHHCRTKIEQPYVLLSQKKNWSDDLVDEKGTILGRIDLNRLVELLIKTEWSGFFESNWKEGILCFLIAENVPTKYRRLVALHEAIEIELQGVAESNILDMADRIKSSQKRKQFIEKEMADAKRYPHTEASEKELHQAIIRGEDFFSGYAEWLWKVNYPDNPQNYFDQAIPGFMARESNLAPVTKVVEFYLHLGYSRTFHLSIWLLDEFIKTIPESSRWLKKHILLIKEAENLQQY